MGKPFLPPPPSSENTMRYHRSSFKFRKRSTNEQWDGVSKDRFEYQIMIGDDGEFFYEAWKGGLGWWCVLNRLIGLWDTKIPLLEIKLPNPARFVIPGPVVEIMMWRLIIDLCAGFEFLLELMVLMRILEFWIWQVDRDGLGGISLGMNREGRGSWWLGWVWSEMKAGDVGDINDERNLTSWKQFPSFLWRIEE